MPEGVREKYDQKRCPAVPRYLGSDFTEAPPGHRFGLYLPAWDEQFKLLNDKKREAIKEVVSLGLYSRDLIRALRERQVLAARSLGPSILHLSAQSTSPFVTGTGIEHPLENGFAFLNPYGVPYLPGSGIKGVARRAAEELALGLWGDRRDWDIPSVWWLFGFEAGSAYLTGPTARMTAEVVREEAQLRRERYLAAIRSSQVDLKLATAFIEKAIDPALGDKYANDAADFLERLAEELPAGPRFHKLLREDVHFRGAVCFWDALIAPGGDTLSVDILNPHFGDYYQKGHSPADCGPPEPNFFLAVPPGSRFDFFVHAADHRLPEGLSRRWHALVQAAFQLAFDWLGFGAKGAVGYGRMERAPEKEADGGASGGPSVEQVGVWAPSGTPEPTTPQESVLSAAAQGLMRRVETLRPTEVSRMPTIAQEIERLSDQERDPVVRALRRRLADMGVPDKSVRGWVRRFPVLGLPEET
jgi:CRISPR-associated protein Cmr6